MAKKGREKEKNREERGREGEREREREIHTHDVCTSYLASKITARDGPRGK